MMMMMKSFIIPFLSTLALSASILENLQEALQFTTPQQQKLQIQYADHDLIKLHKSLVEIPSISGDETALTTYLSDYLSQQGFHVLTNPIPNSDRFNVYAYRGSSPNAKVLLTSHIDTVPEYHPYYTQDGMIYGRGANDAKSSVAAQIIASLDLFQSKEAQDSDLALLFVVGEEYDGIGMKTVSETLDAQWEHVIFGEPTELKLGVGHKGIYHFEITVEGKASHSGYPELGIDANLELLDILQGIRELEFPEDELLGITTVNFGKIDAGLASNIVSPKAVARVLVRVASDTAIVQSLIKSIIEEQRLSYRSDIKLVESQVKEPVYLDFDIPGFSTSVLKYFTDVPNLTKQVQSRYLYGPGSITNAHTPDEHLAVEDLQKGVVGYKKLVKWLLKNK